MILIVMGVSGSGKTTVGELLAQRLHCGFSDADSFHPAANIEKMRLGIPLQAEDRLPWLQAIRTAIGGWQAKGESQVIACSALKQAYRGILSPDGGVTYVYLKGSPDLIRRRLDARKGHYFNPALLDSQFAALEAPGNAITVSIAQTPEAIADDILMRLAK